MKSSPPLAVVILNDHATVNGGSSAVAVASALGLAARGVPVTLFTCVGPVAPELRGVCNLETICLGQAEIARDPNRLRAFASGLRNGRAVEALRGVLALKSPRHTVVHAHTWTKALSPFAPELAAAMGFPLVITLHDFFITCPNGGFFVHPTRQLCTRTPLSAACWRCNCDRRNYAHKLWRNLRTSLQNGPLRLPQKAACFIGVSSFSLGLMRPHLPPDARTQIVRHPIDAAPAAPVPAGRNRRFVFVGRFEEEKGVRLFAEAARQSGVAATFIGDGALGPEVRALCPDARFPGWLGREAIRRELSDARALVFPPLWYETLGLVVIEAAAAGIPSILSDRCAATDHIQDGVHGLHFAHGSAGALSRQMQTLARDDDLASRLGAAAHAWYWRDPWTRERHAAELADLYRDLMPAPATAPVENFSHESPGRIGARS